MHHKGFQDSGIQEVLEAAGVPKGSFYHYFKNKEDFGIQIIDVYAGVMFQTLQNNLDSPNRPVADAIRGFFREMTDHAIRNGFSGCPLGNLSLEMGDVNELFRRKLNEVFGELEHKLEQKKTSIWLSMKTMRFMFFLKALLTSMAWDSGIQALE